MDHPADPVEPAVKPSSGERERLDLLDVALFVRAALLANVSAAGREFGLSAAVASSRIAQLERLLGARLLHRTTRRISLTQDGEVFMTRAQALLDAADAHAPRWAAHRPSRRGACGCRCRRRSGGSTYRR